MNYNRKILLYSGGMDSWLIDKLYQPDLKLFIDIGTASSRAERKRCPADVQVVEFQSLGQFERREDFILPLRNLYLLMIAANYGNEICLGATKTDITCDKTEEFRDKASDILTYLYSKQKWTDARTIRVNLDYKGYTKADLLREYIARGGDWRKAWEETFTCFIPTPEGKECRGCRACFLKLAAFIENGIALPKDLVAPYLPYIEAKFMDKNYRDRLYPKNFYARILNDYQ